MSVSKQKTRSGLGPTRRVPASWLAIRPAVGRLRALPAQPRAMARGPMVAVRQILLSLALLAAGPAWANDPSEGGADLSGDVCLADPICRIHYREARRLSKANQTEQALKEYQAAYAIQPLPRLLFNIARSHHKLAQLRQALQAYDQYLSRSQGEDEDTVSKAKQHREQAQQEIDAILRERAAAQPAHAPGSGPQDCSPSAAPKPLYKTWWFWTAVGVGAAAVIVAGGLAGGLAARGSSGMSPSVDGLPLYDVRF